MSLYRPTLTVQCIHHHLAYACHKIVRSIFNDLLTPVMSHKGTITKLILDYMLVLPLKIVAQLEAQQLQIWCADKQTI